jgi:hypothetical protein
MHEFPDIVEISFLLGDTLVQIGLDPYSTQFTFEESHITAECAVEYVGLDGKVWPYECVAAEGPAIMLHRLVGKKITAVDVQPLRLGITFEDGAVLFVLSEICPYESGQISGNGKFIVF